MDVDSEIESPASRLLQGYPAPARATASLHDDEHISEFFPDPGPGRSQPGLSPPPAAPPVVTGAAGRRLAVRDSRRPRQRPVRHGPAGPDRRSAAPGPPEPHRSGDHLERAPALRADGGTGGLRAVPGRRGNAGDPQ